MRKLLLTVFSVLLLSIQSDAQGTWLPVHRPSPDYFNGLTLLLSDGSLMVKTTPGHKDTAGATWDRLTPDINGSYVNGTWSKMATMHYTRLYCSTQLLKDGRVYVAGGEYGTGGNNGEVYDPLTDTWKVCGPLPNGYRIYDGNSQLLPDGRVLQNIVIPLSRDNVIFDPATDSFSHVLLSIGGADESAWVKLPDGSILFIDLGTKNSERFIPSLNKWIVDDTLPVELYDPFDFELGAGFLLPDGRVFFIGSTSTTAYYTPSGDTTKGRWSEGPHIPDGLGAPDAAAALMPNGNILCALSKTPDSVGKFPTGTYFYEFDYRTNTFTKILTPLGTDTMKMACYLTGMLNLPDGNIFYGTQHSNQYYIYQPGGTPVANGHPVTENVVRINCDTFMAVGEQFNGISQGAAYGDDWQMATNYPVISLVHRDALYGDQVHYVRTYNWNSNGVMRGNAQDTTYFTLPAGLPYDTYDLIVVANGIPSAPYSFTPCYEHASGVAAAPVEHFMNMYPNPAHSELTISSSDKITNVQVCNLLGQTVLSNVYNANEVQVNIDHLPAGVYTVKINNAEVRKLVKE